jgi:putative ABC transport system permease protein
MLWRKVVGDARRDGAQVALIALVIALGTAGVVAALDARSILQREIAASYATARSPDIALWFDTVEPAVLAQVAACDGVAGVDARRVAYSRIAARDGSWLPMRLTILRDAASQSVGKIHRHDESPAVQSGGLWIEQSGRELIAEGDGHTLSVRTASGGLATLPLAGYVHDTSVAPSTQERIVYAFATRDGAVALGQNPEADQVLVVMKTRGDTADAATLGEELRAALKAGGHPPLRVEALPNTHPHAPLMHAMVRVLGVLSAIAILCSAALAAYLVSAWMRREFRLVGVMKAIGGRWHQIAIQYLFLIVPLLLAVAAMALPAGALLGRALVRYYAAALNIDISDWTVDASLRLGEAAALFAIPLAAMAWPIVRASRVNVREAIHDAGIASPVNAGSRLAKSITLPGAMRWTFALRNTLRRPLRLVLVLLALASGGALLLTTHSNYESLMAVIDTSLATQGHDIDVLLSKAVPGAQLEAIAHKVPDVQVAEAWRRAAVSVATGGPGDSAIAPRRVTLLGYPPQSRLFKLPVLEGRAPAPGAADEVLMTRTVREPYPQLHPGSEVRLRSGDRVANVRVVGIVEEIGNPTFYAPFPAFDTVTALGDRSTTLRASAAGDHPDAVAGRLDQAFLDARLPPAQLITRAMFRDSLDEHFKVVGDVIRMVALAAALVGAIVLAAGTSFNVLERTREIGILRALGATPRALAAMLLAEGAAIAAAGALLAIALSVALTLALNGAAARTLLHVAVPLRFSLEGLAILGGGVIVVIVTLGLTLRVSLRRTVRETLNYE